MARPRSPSSRGPHAARVGNGGPAAPSCPGPRGPALLRSLIGTLVTTRCMPSVSKFTAPQRCVPSAPRPTPRGGDPRRRARRCERQDACERALLCPQTPWAGGWRVVWGRKGRRFKPQALSGPGGSGARRPQACAVNLRPPGRAEAPAFLRSLRRGAGRTGSRRFCSGRQQRPKRLSGADSRSSCALVT